jgi:hypothetical protein
MNKLLLLALVAPAYLGIIAMRDKSSAHCDARGGCDPARRA